MEALLVYILKSAGLIALFYCAYYFLLRKETFFNSNRWFLLMGLITSVVLPFVVYTKIIWVDPTPITNVNFFNGDVIQNTEKESFEFNWIYAVITIYCIGFLVLMLKFALIFTN